MHNSETMRARGGQVKTLTCRLKPKHLPTALWGLAFGLSLWQAPLCSQAQSITCGQTITSAISSPEQTTAYTFDAQAGETFDVLVLGQSFNAAADVYDPAGSLVGSCTNNYTGPLKVTATGTCTIRVHADNSVSTGTYGISLLSLTGRCGQPLLWGLPVTNTVSGLAKVDLYTFRGNAGETATLGSSSTNFAAAAFVADPTGTILANWINGVTSLALTNSGTYTVGVYSFYIGGTGTYTLGLAFANLVPASYRLAIGISNGAAALSIRGQVGRTTTLQYAASLPADQWLTLTNFSLPWSPYGMVDWSSTNSPQRFYRTVQ